MMNRRKDSENFPILDEKAKQTDVIDPTVEIEFKEKPVEKKVETPQVKPEKPEKSEKPEKPLILENYKQVISAFEKMMDSIKPGKNMEKVKNLPILDLKMMPTVEELHPTKPRDVFRGSRNKKRKMNSRKNHTGKHHTAKPQTGEQISLTKGRFAK